MQWSIGIFESIKVTHDAYFFSSIKTDEDTIERQVFLTETERELWQLMHQAWQNYRDDSGWAKLGDVGKYLKRIKPDFDTRNYGLKKLSDFFDKFPLRYEKNNKRQWFKSETHNKSGRR